MKIFILSLAAILLVSFQGCAGVDVPSPADLLRQPAGRGGLSPGMTRAQVREKYGQPDITGRTRSPEWRSEREEWIYRARYSALPVGAGYLSEDLYLYFDGDSLTNISNRPIGLDPDEQDPAEIK